MLEIYEIVWRNKDVTGYLEYNTKTDKFQAYLKDRENPNPRGLFGILKISDVVEDSRVRLYISDCVVPKTRENIDDILKHLGMGEYNQWEVYKKNMGVNVSDYASIRFYKNSDSSIYQNQKFLGQPCLVSLNTSTDPYSHHKLEVQNMFYSSC